MLKGNDSFMHTSGSAIRNGANNKFVVKEETFDSITSHRRNGRPFQSWKHVFVLPEWLQVWWQHFGEGFELKLRSVSEQDVLLGIAPLMVKEKTAWFIGSSNVCDYLDFVVAPGKENAFFNVLLDHLRDDGVRELDLIALRPDSSVLTHLVQIAEHRGYDVSCTNDDVSSEFDLPDTWENYLLMLSGKQRHEIRRKLRRVNETASASYRVIEGLEASTAAVDIFFSMFRESREDKAAFMTTRMDAFFRGIVEALSGLKIVKFHMLELDGVPAAMIMCFDYLNTMYLYNSGYEKRFKSASVGVISKALSIKESIQEGKQRYDFLKGAEAYKQRMGGREVPLQRCRIGLR